MTDFTGRDLHVIKRALAVAVAAFNSAPQTAFVPYADVADMKRLLADLMPSDVEMEVSMRSARMALTGKLDP